MPHLQVKAVCLTSRELLQSADTAGSFYSSVIFFSSTSLSRASTTSGS